MKYPSRFNFKKDNKLQKWKQKSIFTQNGFIKSTRFLNAVSIHNLYILEMT